ncbi:MAG TPA: hypothetical protein VFS47_10245 [Steroidobacteraceae bacterium]|nr:hypothetical protein [Steroidobacteraceae bacterium]
MAKCRDELTGLSTPKHKLGLYLAVRIVQRRKLGPCQIFGEAAGSRKRHSTRHRHLSGMTTASGHHVGAGIAPSRDFTGQAL